MVLKEDLPAMKDTAGRAGLYVRSSKDYLLCNQLDYLSVLPVFLSLLPGMECKSVDVKSINHIQELIALVDFTCVTCVPHQLQVAPGATPGMSVRRV